MTCIICEDKATALYEDERIRIVHEAAATRGHLRVMPKQHITLIEELPDRLVEHLFFAANYASAVLFELTGAHGTNIIMNEGAQHIHLDIVERKQDDGINFLWKPKKLTDQEMDAAARKIKDAIVINSQEKPRPVIEMKEKPQEIIVDKSKGDDGKVNWLIRQMDRIP